MKKATNNLSPSMSRQQWLDGAEIALRGLFVEKGFEVPATVRVSIGFPKGSGGRRKTIGQCWASEASGDKHNEVFISPEIGNGVQIFDILAHEFVHATVGLKAGHKKPFKQCAEAIGLTGKMTATTGSDEFNAWANQQIERIGKFPGAALNISTRKKQSTRLLKCACDDCGYTVRMAKKWLEFGTPICPTDEISMTCDAIDDDDEEE